MSAVTRAPRPDPVSTALAKGRLGVPSVVFFVMSAAAPLTVVAGLVTTGYAVSGVTGIPVAFLLVALVLLLFSAGYVAMARHVSNAGAFYTYVARGLGRPAGVGASWVALLAYNAMQVGLYGGFGFTASLQIEGWTGTQVSWWLIALGAWALVALLGVLRVDVNGKVLAVLLVAEIAVVLFFDVVGLRNPAGGSVSFAALSPENLLTAGAGPALVIAITGFVGFEGAAVFTE
ncbi:amino acid permease, partial [Longispora albida]|uniref:amino acid permease n=1 Tax=Longispora albida TaxID=203523 RepID=UPI00035CEC52